jgi:uncharacterized protein (DUF2164 family)
MSQRGRPRAIESPEMLLELFEKYREETKSNPILKHTFVGKDGKSVYEKRERALTIDGFEVYCFKEGIINDLGDYFSNKGERYGDFTTICTRIRQIVREDQIQGGMAGVYNPSITQRLNGLTEKVQTEQNINVNKLPEWLTKPIE